MQSLIADNLVFYPGCSRASLSDSAPSLLQSTCSSDRTAVPRNPHGINLPTFVSTKQTTPVCASAPDPNSDTADLCPPPQSSSPATHPSRYPQTTADGCKTHCPDPADDSPPTAAIPSPRSLPRHLPASAAAKTHPASVDATTRSRASNCRTSAAVAVPTRSASPARCRARQPESPGPPGTGSSWCSVVLLRRKHPASCATRLA